MPRSCPLSASPTVRNLTDIIEPLRHFRALISVRIQLGVQLGRTGFYGCDIVRYRPMEWSLLTGHKRLQMLRDIFDRGNRM